MVAKCREKMRLDDKLLNLESLFRELLELLLAERKRTSLSIWFSNYMYSDICYKLVHF
jgi:hypothetical protein